MLSDDGMSPHRALHPKQEQHHRVTALSSPWSCPASGACLGLNQASTDSGLIKLALICYHQENTPGLEEKIGRAHV